VESKIKINSRICIIGDIMLDRYLIGKASRISPEAPIPVVLLEKESISLGAASFISVNLVNLKSKPLLIGQIGSDPSGGIIKNLLKRNGIDNFLIEKKDYKTTTKTRIISNNQQMLRLDEEEILSLNEDDEKKIIQYIEKQIKFFDCIIISDYAKGMCTDSLCNNVISLANQNKINVLVDPKKNKWDKYNGAFCITPNLKELSEFVGFEIKNEDREIENTLREIYGKINIKNICVTRSEKGISLFDGFKFYHIPAEPIEVYDVTGAGDTVISVVALMLSSGYQLEKSIYYANKAASIVVQKAGTTPILYDEFVNIIEKKEKTKLVDIKQLKTIIEDLRKKNKTIVFTNGCFDILHAGHVIYLEKAKELGNVLIVGLNSDRSVRNIKGDGRPIQNQDDRAKILSSLESVDYVVLFDDDTPEDLIKQIMPDYLVKGSDYKIEDIAGRQYAKKTVTIEYIEGKSSTSIIKNIKKYK